jgi:hypothetical protein
MSEVVIHEVAGMLILQKTKKLKVSIQAPGDLLTLRGPAWTLVVVF